MSMLVLCLLITCAIHANAYERNGIRNIKDYVLDKEPVERQLFHLKKYGFKVDVKVIPSYRNGSAKSEDDDDEDHFPAFPVRDIGKCIFEFSLGCIRKRFVRYLETISSLDEITLHGQDVKLVKSRAVSRPDSARAMNDSDVSIQRTVDDFFDSFILRITLPRWNNKREKNQIDVMMDETAVEGRRKGGGGGGGGLGGCGGGKKGGCNMMMMGMIMMIKMKLLGLAAIKGMMMGGMSMMMLLMQKFGKGGGPWQGGGGPWQGGQLKEIVLLTKSSGGHHGGGGGCCGPSDSYGAPPASSYGAPSGGGGYGGGGWGRSFNKRPMTLLYDGVIKTQEGSNRTLMVGEATSKTDNLDYQDYQEPPIANSNFTTARWNATSNLAFYEYGDNNVNVNSVRNDSKLKLTTNAKGEGFAFNENSSNAKTDVGDEKNVDLMASTNQFDSTEDANSAYMDEWQAMAEKINPSDVSSSNPHARVELRRTESRSRDVPLLRGI